MTTYVTPENRAARVRYAAIEIVNLVRWDRNELNTMDDTKRVDQVHEYLIKMLADSEGKIALLQQQLFDMRSHKAKKPKEPISA